jgi:energy-coupling factor transporter transmembrane protein EcfT
MIFDTRKLISLVMIALFAGAIYFSQGLPSSAAFMPMLVSVPGLILCLFQFALDFKNTPEAAAKTVPKPKTPLRNQSLQ